MILFVAGEPDAPLFDGVTVTVQVPFATLDRETQVTLVPAFLQLIAADFDPFEAVAA